MNTYPWLFLVLVALFLSPMSQVWAVGECEPGVAQVVSVEGRVEAKRAGQALWEPVTLQETFCAGDSIRVEARSRAAILLGNETLLRLDQGTAITFSEIDEQETSWLELIKGAVYFLSRMPRTLRIKTAFVNAAVEGTEFAIRVEPDQTLLWVFEGRILASNDAGQLTLLSAQAATARAGEAPQERLVVRPRDAVQWALYYPPIIDYRAGAYPTGPGARVIQEALVRYQQDDLQGAFARLEAVPAELRDVRYYTLRAGLLLSVGRVDEARADIEQILTLDPNHANAFALQAVMAVVQSDRDQALTLAQRAVDLAPRSPVPQVALSYAHQARFDIDKALEAAQEAVNLGPANALAWARLAELRLATGNLDRALKAAQEAVMRNPDLARTQTVLGFAYLTRIETKQARAAFEKAIVLDQADPLPRLGLGLAKIRQSDLREGRREMEIAAALDPNTSLIRSYLGKAYFEERRAELAGTEFAIAKELDPRDPTPWFYDAIRQQLQNRPVEALRELERSIALNDNRAVYRSRLLLDDDLAVRGISLARLYDDLGFDQLALVEGSKSLSIDPANHSAHRFLSDTYARLPRHEIARVSELLQAQLLQPININPVQPRLAVSDLNIVAGAGPAEAAFNEFHPLFERNRPQLVASGVIGNNDTLADEVVLSGLFGRLSYSLGQFHSETDGFRDNNDIDNDLYNAFAQVAVTPKLNVQAEYRRRETEQGDLTLNFDPDDFSDLRRDLEEDTLRLGIRFAPSPQSDLIFSLIYTDREEELVDPFFVPFPLIITRQGKEQGYQLEAQYLFRAERFNVAAGGGIYDIDVDQSGFVSFPDFPDFPPDPLPAEDFTREQENAYVYANIPFPKNLTWTIGLSYDSFEQDPIDLDELNPKAGLQWNLTDHLRLRFAAFQTVKRALVVEQTVEPTQVAGFNQFFDDPNGTRTERYGIGLDARLIHNLFGGVEVSRRDLEFPSITTTEQGSAVTFHDRREDLYRAYLYWTPHSDWAASAEYRFEKFKQEAQAAGSNPVRMETTAVPLAVRYFNLLGLFAELGGTFVHQDIDRRPGVQLTEGNDNFVMLDAAAGYRLPNRRGIISLEVRNLLDEEFFFQDDNFRTSEIRNPRFIPERTLLGRITLNF